MQQNSKYQRIWQVIGLIPQGKVASYGQVADLAGLPGNARLVSKALKHAPTELRLPWFRVVNSQRKISFPFATPMYQKQKSYLASEGVVFTGRTISKENLWQPDVATLLFSLDF